MPDEGHAAEKRRLFLIMHGNAAGNWELREAVNSLRSTGTRIEVRVTWEPGDAARYAKEAVEGPFDVAVAAGGDGTLNEVVNGILETESDRQIAAAVIPMGTANDFAVSCGLLDHTPADALKLAAGGGIQPIDIGKLNGRYFINVVSGGFGAEVSANTPPEMKQMFGGAAYSLMGLVHAFNFRPYEARIELDDQSRDVLLLMLAVGNGRQCGGGYRVAPKAQIDDGFLDVVLARNADYIQWRAVYQEMADPDLDEHQFVDYHRLKSFRMETEEPFHMNLDGEPLQGKSFEFEICEKRLPFVLPRGCPMLSEAAPIGK